MKLEMKKEDLRRFLLHAPQEKILTNIEEIHPVDILDVIRDYPKDRLDILYRIPEKLVAQVIDEAETEEKYDILTMFSDNTQKNIIEQMSSDELADLLGMLNEDQVNRILAKMTEEDARQVRLLLSYDPDTAAGIMATEFISIKETMTIEEALKYLQVTARDSETAFYLYVIDSFEKLKGVVSLSDIVTHAFETRISDIINTNVKSIPYDMDKEEVGHAFEKYGYFIMPVVDSMNRLLGIVTVDDAMQVLKDENTEDIHRLGGVQMVKK